MHYLAGYRLRNLTLSPAGDTLFVAVDNSCCTLGASGTIGNSVASPNLGFILRMVYLTTLALPDTARKAPPPRTSRLPRVYPNPAHGELFIAPPADGLKPFTAQLYSVAGQLLRSQTTGTGTLRMDIRDVQPGVYFLRLVAATESVALINKVLIE
jgi:hypothetical protein